MKLGIILLLVGIVLIVLLSRINVDKKVLKNAGVVLGFFIIIYGIILIVQPSEDNYIKSTKTTTSYKDHIEKKN
jgi:uncharacterized membrane protein YozB (DUF420 family)